MASKAPFLQLSRKVHLYFGLFISPALLFFAFTGAYQTLGLHEAASNYKPPAFLASLAQLHKKQTYLLPARRGPGPEAGRPAAGDEGHPAGAPDGIRGRQRGADRTEGAANPGRPARLAEGTPAGAQPGSPGQGARQPQTLAVKQKQHLPLKIFFLIVSLGLFVGTLTGIYMAFRYDRNKVLVTALLLLGALTPIVLARF
jgi:hypothetical protein